MTQLVHLSPYKHGPFLRNFIRLPDWAPAPAWAPAPFLVEKRYDSNLLLNNCSSCQQFPLLCLFPFPRSSVTRERDEKRSARSWNLRVISRTQQAVKTDNRSSHSLSLSLSRLAHALAKSIEIQTQKGTLLRNTLLECMLIRTFTSRPEKINRLM